MGRRVGAAASEALGAFRRSGSDRLGEGFFGLGKRTPASGGLENRPEPDRDKGTDKGTDKGKAGSKRHIVVDRRVEEASLWWLSNRLPTSPRLEGLGRGCGRHIEPLRKPPRGRPRASARREEAVHADKAYDLPRCREALRKRGITPRIARRGIESSEKLGRYRWVVERTLSWVNRNRRLKARYERRDDIHQAFLDLGCALICWRYVQRLC